MLAKQVKRSKSKAKPKTKKGKAKQPANAKQLRAASIHDQIRLTHGGYDYIACVLDPRAGPLARVPYGFPVRSRTMRVKCTGTFTCANAASTAAWVCVNPWRLIANDTVSVVATNASYVGIDTSFMSDTSAGVSYFSSNSDYTVAALSVPTISFRLVSAELNVSATSSLLSRQGSLYLMTEPSHENFLAQAGNLIDGVSPATVSNYEGCRVRAIPMSNQIERCIWGTPEKPGEVEWLNLGQLDDERTLLVASGLSAQQANQFLASDMGYGPYYSNSMCAIVSGGTSGTSATVCRFEVYAVFEVVGNTVTGRGPGVSDPVAFQAASNYIQRTPGSTQIGGTAKDALVYLGQQMGYVSPKGDVQYGSLIKDSLSAVGAAAKYLV